MKPDPVHDAAVDVITDLADLIADPDVESAEYIQRLQILRQRIQDIAQRVRQELN